MNAPLLEVTNLHARYGRVAVLFGIDFSVTEGGITTILGANGAGKTTTLRAISALISAHGQILFQGERIDGRTHRSDRCAQDCPCARRTRHARPPLGRGKPERWRVHLAAIGADESFEQVFHYFPKLRERRGQQAGTLSGGEQQMLAIGRALMLQPKLLLMDEPSFGLAPRVVDELFDIMRSINREQRVSILLVEQNAKHALAVADHAFLLETGRVVISGPADALLKDEAVRRSYLGY